MSTPLSFAHCIYKCFFLVPMLFTANLQKQRNVQTCLPCVEKSIFLWYFCRQTQTLLCKTMQKRFCVLRFFVQGKADLFNGHIVMLATNFFVRLQLFATFCRYLKDVDRKLFAKRQKRFFVETIFVFAKIVWYNFVKQLCFSTLRRKYAKGLQRLGTIIHRGI